MAHLPEVRPEVVSMPIEGFIMQTGGSARRSFIKNTGNNDYFVHGVPGHTHNASAMISVTADYERRRGVTSTIDREVWADEDILLAEEHFVDSIEPEDAEDRYERSIERGIGSMTLIPENCQHTINEPTRSISEIRSIVTPKDQIKSMTYVNNEFGWVSPVTGELDDFNNCEPVQVNFFGYSALPELITDELGRVDIQSPVYIGALSNRTHRYLIADRGASAPGGAQNWDGNVPFYWEEQERVYRSRPFDKYFTAVELKTDYASASNTLEIIGKCPRIDKVIAVAGGGGGQITIPANAQMDVVAAGKTFNRLVVSNDQPQYIPFDPQNPNNPHHDLLNFKVSFPAYETSQATDGYCILSRATHRDPTSVTASAGADIIPLLPVTTYNPTVKIYEQTMWFGPSAYRIPVGQHYALPGPPRSVVYTSEDGGNYPGRTDDRSETFFKEIRMIENAQQMTRQYALEFRKMVAEVADEQSTELDLVTQNASIGGNQVAMPANRFVVADNMYATYWSNCTPNFGFSPYGFFNAALEYHATIVQNPNQVQITEANRPRLFNYRGNGLDNRFKYEKSPYIHGGLFMPSNPATSVEIRQTVGSQVNRKQQHMRAIQHQNGNVDNITLVADPYNQLVACPLLSFLHTCAIKLRVAQGAATVLPQYQGADIQGIPLDQFLGHRESTPNFSGAGSTALFDLQIVIPRGTSTSFLVHASGAPWVANNTGVNRYKIHHREWVDRSLIGFNDEREQYFGTSIATYDFTPAYDEIRTNSKFAFNGGYRLYSAELQMQYRRTQIHNVQNTTTNQFENYYQVVDIPPGNWRITVPIQQQLLMADGTPMFEFHPLHNGQPIAAVVNGVVQPNHFRARKALFVGAGPFYATPWEVTQYGVDLSGTGPLNAYNQDFGFRFVAQQFNPLAMVPQMDPDVDEESEPFICFMDHTKTSYEQELHLLDFTMPCGHLATSQAMFEDVEEEKGQGPFRVHTIDHYTENHDDNANYDQVTGHYQRHADEFGNYFVLDTNQILSHNVDGVMCLEFPNKYWEFAKNRPMFLLFNNYGRAYQQLDLEYQRTVGNINANPPTGFGNFPGPLNGPFRDYNDNNPNAEMDPVYPYAYAFSSSDCKSRLSTVAGVARTLSMYVPQASLMRVPHDGGNAVPFAPIDFNRVACTVQANGTLNDDGANAQTLNGYNQQHEETHQAPKFCIFIPGEKWVEKFMTRNYESIRADGRSLGLVHRVRNKISQHLCAPILNPNLRIGCIAPLNHETRHLPPEMRDFRLIMDDVNFDFLLASETPKLGDIVLSEFNGGIQKVAVAESLLYLPNFREFTTQVQEDLTFSVDCYSSTGVPAYMCFFCRDDDDFGEQPIIITLSLENKTTHKKSDTIYETDVHELFHLTQRNVHDRATYDHVAFNKRQTILLATEDIGIMGMSTTKHYQKQKRIVVHVSGRCSNTGTFKVLFIYNNRGLFLQGVQQSVIQL